MASELKKKHDKVVAQDRIVEVGTAGETTKPVPQESTKPKYQKKQIQNKTLQSAVGQVQKEQLPNTGSAEGHSSSSRLSSSWFECRISGH